MKRLAARNHFCVLAAIFSCCLFGCSTISQRQKWPVFYDSGKEPESLLISDEAKPLSFYTNQIPEWNYDLTTPSGTKINSSVINELGKINGLRIVEARFSLTDTYYSDEQIFLQELKPDAFLPVYVQVYNRDVRWPSATKVAMKPQKISIETAMNYAGTGHFQNAYLITLFSDRKPIVRNRNPEP